MTARARYKPEGWPTAADDVAPCGPLSARALDLLKALIADPAIDDESWREAYDSVVIAYRALKAWEAERR